MAFEINTNNKGKRLQTRGGLEVRDWKFVTQPHRTIFPIKAIVVRSDGTTEEILYTRSGRRYIDRESEFDLMPLKEWKSKREEGLDCMPNVLKAIRCIRNNDKDGLRAANKNADIYREDKRVYTANIEIGEL